MSTIHMYFSHIHKKIINKVYTENPVFSSEFSPAKFDLGLGKFAVGEGLKLEKTHNIILI